MKVLIKYASLYEYPKPVSFSPHIFRLFPRADPSRLVIQHRFETNSSADVQYRRDAFDNDMIYCFYPEKQRELISRIDVELKLHERNPFHFILDSHALKMPFSYKPAELVVLSPFLHRHEGDEVELPFWTAPRTHRPTVETLVELNRAIHEHIRYEVREKGAARTPSETVRIGKGACRDYCRLLASVLRQLGLAARLVSGYLCEFEAEEEARRAVGSFHAWTDVYLPGAGWIGMDPTNGVFCNHNFIPAAVGLTPADISPTSGHYYGRQVVESRMQASLELIKC